VLVGPELEQHVLRWLEQVWAGGMPRLSLPLLLMKALEQIHHILPILALHSDQNQPALPFLHHPNYHLYTNQSAATS